MDKERNAVDDRMFLEAIADLIGEYGSGKVAFVYTIGEKCAEKGYVMDVNRLKNCAKRMKARSLIDSDFMRVSDNFTVVDGEKKRTVPVRRGYVLTILGWREVGKPVIE